MLGSLLNPRRAITHPIDIVIIFGTAAVTVRRDAGIAGSEPIRDNQLVVLESLVHLWIRARPEIFLLGRLSRARARLFYTYLTFSPLSSTVTTTTTMTTTTSPSPRYPTTEPFRPRVRHGLLSSLFFKLECEM